jgi:hypothetical protein
MFNLQPPRHISTLPKIRTLGLSEYAKQQTPLVPEVCDLQCARR